MSSLTQSFKFAPLDYVTITSHGNKIAGRVLRCIIEDGSQPMYDIDYMDHGEFRRREFYEDELEANNG